MSILTISPAGFPRLPFHSSLKGTLLAAGILCLLPSVSTAASIVTTWNFTVNSRFNHVTGENDDDFVPISNTLTIVFPAEVDYVVDDGTSTITDFGAYGATTVSNPISTLIGNDPYGSGVMGSTYYAFAGTNDYEDGFIEGFTIQGWNYSYDNPDDPSYVWYHGFSLRVDKRSANRGGTGSADYAFTTNALLDFLNEFKDRGNDAYQDDETFEWQGFNSSFSQSYQLYDSDTGDALDGYSWEGYGTLTLTNIEVIPEPASFAFLLSSSLLLAFSRKRRN